MSQGGARELAMQLRRDRPNALLRGLRINNRVFVDILVIGRKAKYMTAVSLSTDKKGELTRNYDPMIYRRPKEIWARLLAEFLEIPE